MATNSIRVEADIEENVPVEHYNDEFSHAEARHKFTSACGRYIYHVAIIDYLTEFNIQKRLESFFKI